MILGRLNVGDSRDYVHFLEVCEFIGLDYEDGMEVKKRGYSPTSGSYESYYQGEELSSFDFRTTEDI